MKSPERYLDPEDRDSLRELREHVDNTLGKPFPAEIRILLVSQYSGLLKKTIFKPLFSDKNRLKNHLRSLKTRLYPNNPYYSPLVCASQINYVKEGIMAEAKLAAGFVNQDNQLKFAVLFDIAHGMELVVNSVVVAEDNLRNPSKTILPEVVDYYAERFNLDHVENTEVFLRNQRLFSHFAELLRRDNSGYSVIKDVIKLLKDSRYSETNGINTPLPPFLVREFVSAGADLGAKLYKKLYPLTDQTTPPKSSIDS